MKKFCFLLLGLFLFNGANAQIINFPDANFKAKLLEADTSNNIAENLSGNYFKIDSNNNGEIEVSEAMEVSFLNVSNSAISSLEEISNFKNVGYLDCSENQLSSLDTNGLVNLGSLDCSENQITSLNISSLSNLWSLNYNANQISSLDVNALTNLQYLECVDNQITSLDISNLTNLTSLMCYHNQLTSLILGSLPNLTTLICRDNQLTSLDLNGLESLISLDCSINMITSLDVSNSKELMDFLCNDNSLIWIVLKNGIAESTYNFINNPNLQYICADEIEIEVIQTEIQSCGLTNCQINTYCSFVPGGTYYTVQGNANFDNNNNGCDTLDIIYPNLNFSIFDGIITGSIISNVTGSYSIPVQAGTYTITPKVENQTYFNVFPTTVTVTFPTETTPFTQYFCLTANGVHPDLEITLLPIGPARPGFDAIYKIIYKNKGNQTQSGSVNLIFDDAVLDFMSSTPSTTTQTINNLSWDYTNLLPFETREIALTFNVNAPTDTPAVNNGDQLNFSTEINPIAGDETPGDNVKGLKQIVVGSYDPNDKTCLEGTTITPEMVGEYVHYVIRFENTGTFPAENIVVKDMIDLAKFDINTLIPIKGSHEFVTNITAGNKVEFIFENINLPFDDANNDGFVAFKIKTKPNLVKGDTFTNSANIYFDYNFPIVTNTASTTVQTLGKSDFEFDKYFTVYPNPASTELNLSVKSGIEVSAINIYNTLGQLVIAIPNAQSVSNIDVSRLTTGNYFIKMVTNKGTSNTKFIKN